MGLSNMEFYINAIEKVWSLNLLCSTKVPQGFSALRYFCFPGRKCNVNAVLGFSVQLPR